ncbi:CgeB family protein [Sinisalibacter aestuarii]|nr:glycosyltransferase [Sinisalibacter aestuarii]
MESRGFCVIKADRHRYMAMGTRFERSLAARLNLGRGVRRFNLLLEAVAERDRFDVVFVDKGVWVRPQTLRQLKSCARLLVHYTPDAQFREYRSRKFLRSLPDYDLSVTTKPFEIEDYRAAGATNVMLIHQGFGGRIKPVPDDDIPDPLVSDVCFVGHYQSAYAHILRLLADRVPLAIWGPGWTEYARTHTWAKNVVRGGALFGKDYASAISGAKIAIGLLSKRIPETTTTRSFEIPACGTMLLAERTNDHMALFDEGREAEFFSTPAELCDKAAYYLEHPVEREAIAAAGLARSWSSGYAIEDQFRSVIDWILCQITPRAHS